MFFFPAEGNSTLSVCCFFLYTLPTQLPKSGKMKMDSSKVQPSFEGFTHAHDMRDSSRLRESQNGSISRHQIGAAEGAGQPTVRRISGKRLFPSNE